MSHERAGVEVYIGFAGDEESYWSAGETQLLDLGKIPNEVYGLLHGSDLGVDTVEGQLSVTGDDAPEYHVTITLSGNVPDNVADLFLHRFGAVR